MVLWKRLLSEISTICRLYTLLCVWFDS